MENGQTVHFIRSFQSINFPSEQGVGMVAMAANDPDLLLEFPIN